MDERISSQQKNEVRKRTRPFLAANCQKPSDKGDSKKIDSDRRLEIYWFG
jgi:hypothetical protein